MKCEAQYGTRPHPCPYPATTAVIAPGGPDFVCGYHAGAYTEGRIGLRFFGRLTDEHELFMRKVVSFLKEMNQLGFGVIFMNGSIIIQVGGQKHASKE